MAIASAKYLLKVLVALLLLALPLTTHAQGEITGALVAGQPAAVQVTAGQTINLSYSAPDARVLSLQALSDSAQPTLTILQEGVIIAEDQNFAAQSIINLSAVLIGGEYIVQVGAANNTSGTVLVIVQAETPISVEALAPGVAVTGVVSSVSPLALYTFSALDEQAFLYIESQMPDHGPFVRVLNAEDGRVRAEIAPELAGARLRIPPGAVTYQVEVAYADFPTGEPYSLCLALVSAGGCETPVVSSATQPPVPVSTQEVQPPLEACTVRRVDSGAANIRQYATTTNSPIIGSLPTGASAEVIGISPDRSFYRIRYNNLTGWIAAVVVVPSGDCATLPTVDAPLPPPPIQPTQPPQPPAVTQPPQPAPTHTPSGPCLITMTAEALVYTQPQAIPDYIYDEVQPGYELVPVGRTADNSWWRTNYAGSWIQYSTIQSSAVLSGDCSQLPIL